MAMDFIGLSVGMGYTDETAIGGGALKGKNCVVSNIEEVADGVNVTFQWTLDDGTVKTDTAFIPKGTQDAELIDSRIDKDGNTHVNVGEHIRTVSSQLSSEIYRIVDENVVIPANNTDIYELYIPVGHSFCFETLDGSLFGVTTTVRLLREDKSEIDYYSIFENTASREMINDVGEDIFFVRMVSDILNKPIRIRLNEPSKLINKLQSQTEENHNFLLSLNRSISSVIINNSQLRNGSIVNALNTECISTPNILTDSKNIKVVTDRPNKEGCEYLYSFASSKTTSIDLNYDRQYTEHIDYDNNTDNTYPISDNCYGVQIAISERNKETSEISPLRISDFEGYNIIVYDISDNEDDKLSIPNFYRNYLDERINTIRNRDLVNGNCGDSFIFITDLHNENNYYSPKLAKYIIDNTSVKKLVYGGDMINEPTSEKNVVANMLFDRVKICRTVDDCVFLVGNHDTNPYGTYQITKNELYSIFVKPLEHFVNTDGKTYFYRDNLSQKIRYFYLDSGENGTMDEIQSEWLKTNSESLNEEWTIVIFTHYGIYSDIKDDRVPKQYPIISTIKTALLNITCSIAAIICGHTHIDMVDTSGNYPIICTTCDAHGVQATSMSSDVRTAGTINEQAFDIFHINTLTKKIYATRIGGGQNNVLTSGDYTLNDREFSYN